MNFYLQMKFNGILYAGFDGKRWHGSVILFMLHRFDMEADVFVVKQAITPETNTWTITGYSKSSQRNFAALKPIVDLGKTSFIAPLAHRVYVTGPHAPEFKISCLKCSEEYHWGIHNASLCPECLDILPKPTLRQLDLKKYH